MSCFYHYILNMLKQAKAFIFDLDGVITDTSSLHEKAWRKLAQEENIPFDEQLADNLRGVSRRESLELILKNSTKIYTEDEFQKLMERKNKYYKESISELSPENLFPGVIELLKIIKLKGYKIALASSSKNAGFVVEKLGIRHVFDATVYGTEITKTKPDPEIFLIAAEKMGIMPNNCFVVEDALSGVEAANAGGFISIGIGPENRFSDKSQFRFNILDELVKNLIL